MITGLSHSFGRPQFGSGSNLYAVVRVVGERNADTICDQREHHLAHLLEGGKYQKGQGPDHQTAVNGQAQTTS